MAACRESLRALGLNQGATPAEIKTAFRMLAKTWHPDKHSGASKAAAEQRFKQIALAYETLVAEEAEASSSTARGGGRGAGPRRSRERAYETWGTRAQYGSASRPGYNPYRGYMDFGADTPAGEARARTERRRMQWTLGCVATFVLGLSAVTLSARRDNRRLESGELVEAYFNQVTRRWEKASPSMKRDPLLSTLVHLKSPEARQSPPPTAAPARPLPKQAAAPSQGGPPAQKPPAHQPPCPPIMQVVYGHGLTGSGGQPRHAPRRSALTIDGRRASDAFRDRQSGARS